MASSLVRRCLVLLSCTATVLMVIVAANGHPEGVSSPSTLTIIPTYDWTNATFETHLCSNLTSMAPAVTSLNILTSSSGYPGIYLLPDCFYSSSSTIQFAQLKNVIVSGSEIDANPIVRLGKSLSPSASIISLSGSRLLDPTGNRSPLSWNTLWQSFPSLISVEFANMDLGNAPTLPSNIPLNVTRFIVTHCGLTGRIPAGMFGTYTGNNTFFELTLSGNALKGVLPDNLLGTPKYSDLKSFTLKLDQNQLIGSIPDTLFVSTNFVSLQNLEIDLSKNRFSGNAARILQGVTFASGTLQNVTIRITENFFSGAVPIHVWFAGRGSEMMNFLIDAYGNSLDTPLPNNYIIAIGFYPNRIQFVQINLTDNLITGDIPAGLLQFVDVDMLVSSDATFLVGLAKNLFNGAITFPKGSTVSMLDISENTRLKGTLIKEVFMLSAYPLLQSFQAGNTALSGKMTDMGSEDANSILSLVMTGVTYVDFCSPPRTAWKIPGGTGGPGGYCNLDDTQADSSCRSLYPSKCFTTPPPPPPSTPPSSDLCSPATKPQSGSQTGWYCASGFWTHIGDVTGETLTIPDGSINTIVKGSVLASNIVFQGTDSRLTVQDNGCLPNLHTVTFDITNDDLDVLPTPVYIKTVIVTIPSLCGDWKNLKVVSNVIGKTCRKLTVTASTSSTGSLVASFTPDSTNCRQKKWVIPVAVGVSVLLTVLIVISLCIYCRRRKSTEPEGYALINH